MNVVAVVSADVVLDRCVRLGQGHTGIKDPASVVLDNLDVVERQVSVRVAKRRNSAAARCGIARYERIGNARCPAAWTEGYNDAASIDFGSVGDITVVAVTVIEVPLAAGRRLTLTSPPPRMRRTTLAL